MVMNIESSEVRTNFIQPESRTKDIEIVQIKQPDGVWILDIKIGKERHHVKVFHLREDSHKRDIAKALISGEPVAAFGVGNYGLAVGIDHPKRVRSPRAWESYWQFKPQRPKTAKIPILLPPKYWGSIVDRRKIHPKFKPMFTREGLERAYKEAVIFHIVAPSFDYAPHINHPALITSENGRNSVSAFWWHDPDLEEVADLAMRFNQNMLIGISSFNDHGENPAFNYDDVIAYIIRKRRVPFKFIVRDEIGESVGVRSSHPQFKVPEKGDEPIWKVVRKGSRSVERFLEATHLPFGAIGEEEAPFAPRDYPEDANLDHLVDKVHVLTLEDYKRRKAT